MTLNSVPHDRGISLFTIISVSPSKYRQQLTHIVGSVNVRTRSAHRVLVDERRSYHKHISISLPLNPTSQSTNVLTETIRSSTSMIRATIPTTARPGRNTRILPNNQAHIRIQRRVRVIRKHDRSSSWRISSHVLVQHSEDSLAGRSVV